MLEDGRIACVSLNVEGKKHHRIWWPWLEQINPSVLMLMELLRTDFDTLRERGYAGIFAPTIVDKDYGDKGVALLTRGQIEGMHIHYLETNEQQPPIPREVDSDPHLGVVVTGIIEGLRFATTHFSWTKDGRISYRQICAMGRLLSVLGESTPDVFAGDFNMAARRNSLHDQLVAGEGRNGQYINLLEGVCGTYNVQSTIDPTRHRMNQPDPDPYTKASPRTPARPLNDAELYPKLRTRVDMLLVPLAQNPVVNVVFHSLIFGLSDHAGILFSVLRQCNQPENTVELSSMPQTFFSSTVQRDMAAT